jgi:hypothetical protein
MKWLCASLSCPPRSSAQYSAFYEAPGGVRMALGLEQARVPAVRTGCGHWCSGEGVTEGAFPMRWSSTCFPVVLASWRSRLAISSLSGLQPGRPEQETRPSDRQLQIRWQVRFLGHVPQFFPMTNHLG